MTREDALKNYEEAGRQIEQLIERRANLKKIIFAEILTPGIIRKSEFNPQTRRHNNGETQQIVANTLTEHGGELRANDIATLTNLNYHQVTGALRKMEQKHVVHKRKVSDKATEPVYWTMAIHQDKSELNHL